MTIGADLYHLQCLDSEADAKQRRLAQVEAALNESIEVRQARQEAESAQEQARQFALRQRDLEYEIQEQNGKIASAEQLLYSGSVRNPKELADLQADVAALKRRRQKLEDELLEVMVEREQAESALAKAQATLEAVEARWTSQQATWIDERATLTARLEEIERARAALLPRIDAADLDAYQSLRRRKGGQAVALLRDGTCAGCGVVTPPSLEWQLRQGRIVHCSNCERILVQA